MPASKLRKLLEDALNKKCECKYEGDEGNNGYELDEELRAASCTCFETGIDHIRVELEKTEDEVEEIIHLYSFFLYLCEHKVKKKYDYYSRNIVDDYALDLIPFVFRKLISFKFGKKLVIDCVNSHDSLVLDPVDGHKGILVILATLADLCNEERFEFASIVTSFVQIENLGRLILALVAHAGEIGCKLVTKLVLQSVGYHKEKSLPETKDSVIFFRKILIDILYKCKKSWDVPYELNYGGIGFILIEELEILCDIPQDDRLLEYKK